MGKWSKFPPTHHSILDQANLAPNRVIMMTAPASPGSSQRSVGSDEVMGKWLDLRPHLPLIRMQANRAVIVSLVMTGTRIPRGSLQRSVGS